jgi:MYXO-CTERM domain-containing protein
VKLTDSLGNTATASVTVTSGATGDAGTGADDGGGVAVDGGNGAADSGTVAPSDGGPDAGSPVRLAPSTSGGCGCTTAGGAQGSAQGLALSVMGLLAVLARRRIGRRGR